MTDSLSYPRMGDTPKSLQNRALISNTAVLQAKKNYAFLCLKRSKFSLCVFHSHSVCLYYTISFSWPDSFYYCLFFLSVVATNMSSGVQICLKMRGNLAERLRVKCSRIHSAFVTLFSTSADTQRSESLGLTTHLAL